MHETPICQIITPVGMLGYGFDEKVIDTELTYLVPTNIPTAIILDSGSTDSGPQKLALGSMTCSKSAYIRDLTKLLQLVHKYHVPLIFSSAGGDGTDEHVKEIGEIIKDIAATSENKDYCFKTLSLFSGIDKATIIDRLKNGNISGCGVCVPPLTEAAIKASPRVVAQVGHEPFVDAMDAQPDFDIIIGGRAYDPSPYAAYCLHQLRLQFPDVGIDGIQSRLGGFLHMGKVMECGGLCSLPKSQGAVATVYESGLFDIRPTAPKSVCTPTSVAAHTLYENTRPDILRGPGGNLHLNDTKYKQLSDGRTVRVSGSKFRSSKEDRKPYQLKLEAAQLVGYRSMFLGSCKDHILISIIDKLLASVKAFVKEQHRDIVEEWDLNYHVYGKDTFDSSGPGELFIIVEAIAKTQQLASSITSMTRIAMIHAPYPGQKATAGNFGFGIGGLTEIEVGACAEFSVYHLMDLEPGEEHLVFNKENTTSSGTIGRLLRGSVATIGSGVRSSLKIDHKTKIIHGELPRAPVEITRSSGQSASTPNPIQDPKTLSDLCHILRSKNAGPFEVTIDAIFYSESDYSSIKETNLLSPSNVAKALGISQEDIIWMGFFDPALAFKVTIPRVRLGKKKSAGGFMENDVHGSQEHLGLASIKLSRPSHSVSTIISSSYGSSTKTIVLTTFCAIGILCLRPMLMDKR